MKEETRIAILPSVLAQVVCHYCTACEVDDAKREYPAKCDAAKRFVREVKQKTNRHYEREKQKRATNTAIKSSI